MADRARLESECTFTGTEGSNPSFSARKRKETKEIPPLFLTWTKLNGIKKRFLKN